MSNNLPFQNFIDRQYFEVKTTPIPGIMKDNSQTFVTPKGELWLAKIFTVFNKLKTNGKQHEKRENN